MTDEPHKKAALKSHQTQLRRGTHDDDLLTRSLFQEQHGGIHAWPKEGERGEGGGQTVRLAGQLTGWLRVSSPGGGRGGRMTTTKQKKGRRRRR